MDFSNAGTTKPAGAGFRAHVQWNDKGAKRNIYGPSREDQQAAHEDLESMRAAASGMSREDGFAAMAAEAESLKAGKPPSKQGSVLAGENGFYARFQWRATGEKRHVYGPLRAEEKRAQADLEAVTGGGALRTGPLAMHPSVGFASLAQVHSNS